MDVLSMEHAGEEVFKKAWELHAGGATVGAIAGAILGWPHRYVADKAGSLNLYSYRNAFTSSDDFSDMVVACICTIGLLAFVGAALTYGFLAIRKSGKTP